MKQTNKPPVTRSRTAAFIRARYENDTVVLLQPHCIAKIVQIDGEKHRIFWTDHAPEDVLIRRSELMKWL